MILLKLNRIAQNKKLKSVFSLKRGATLVELLITMAIAGIVFSLIMGTYFFVNKLYIRWNNSSAMLNSAMLIQKALEKETGEADSINIVDKENLVFYNHKKGEQAFKVIENSLSISDLKIPLSDIKFEFADIKYFGRQGYMNHALLEWHCSLNKKGQTFSWIGGRRTGIY